eukprot:5320032-Amphidinium_carterae.1
MDEELVIQWKLRLTNDEGDRLPQWTDSIERHREDLHPGTTTDDAALHQEETEGKAKVADQIALEDRQDAHRRDRPCDHQGEISHREEDDHQGTKE